MKRNNLYTILAGLFCGCLVLSNVLACKTFALGGVAQTCGILVFPVVYIVNDVLTECYGYRQARRVIWLGFALNALAALCYQIAIALPSYDQQQGAAFATVLESSWRICTASLLSYLAGSVANAWVLDRMRRGRSLMVRCIASTILGESLDSLIFLGVAFAGTLPAGVILGMVALQAGIKTTYEIVAFPATKLIVNRINTISD